MYLPAEIRKMLPLINNKLSSPSLKDFLTSSDILVAVNDTNITERYKESVTVE